MRKISQFQDCLLDLVNPNVRHDAKYSVPLYPHLRRFLQGAQRILDPMCGVGTIHNLGLFGETYGIEIEPEWADAHPRTQVGSVLALPWEDDYFDAICVSPPYGNRLCDNYEAHDREDRLGYRHALGRPPHPDNVGTVAFGPAYQDFFQHAWSEVSRVHQRRGVFVLNVKDFYENHHREYVTDWHIGELTRQGYVLVDHVTVPVKGYVRGKKSQRMSYESVILFQRETEQTHAHAD